MREKTKKFFRGQVIVEYTFCLIIVFLMVYSMIKIFRWSGVNLAQRQKDHQTLLIAPINPDVGKCLDYDINGVCLARVEESEGPLKQIDPYFSDPLPMNAVWLGD